MRIYILIAFALLSVTVTAQRIEGRVKQHVDLTFGVASYRGCMSLSYVRNWQLGKQRKIGVGLGGRFTSFVGANQYYITAPAKLTSGSTSPLILFKDNLTENIDSLLVKSPQVNAFNISINLNYAISKNMIIGFNIDAVGLSFGGYRRANYMNGIAGKNTEAKPTFFNVLLISDNDRGTLNSELFLQYSFNEKWAVKLGGQFLFTEYTTRTKVQELPEQNDRFRNKSLLLAIGLCYKIGKGSEK